MYAALVAARAGARVMLVDRSLIGRGGATVMAQMTVAVALGEEVPDEPEHHLADTLQAGRGLCDTSLSQLLCEEAPACIREMDAWGVGWARKDGHISQVQAPGHDRPRCVYVDFVNTGPAVSKTLRGVVTRTKNVRKAGDLFVIQKLCERRIIFHAPLIVPGQPASKQIRIFDFDRLKGPEKPGGVSGHCISHKPHLLRV